MSFLHPAIFYQRRGAAAFVLSGAFPDSAEGVFYMHKLTATGAVGAIAWDLSTGALPVNFRLDAATGYVAGVHPVEAMSLSMSGGSSTRSGQRFNSQSRVFDNAAGGVAFDLSSGSLPPGLSIDPNTGEISGVVT